MKGTTGRPWPVLALLLLGAAAVLPVRAGDEEEVYRLLMAVRADEDTEAWRAAVRELRSRGGVASAMLDEELEVLLSRHRKGLTDALEKLEGLAGDDEESKREQAAREAWERCREDARAFIADESAFPDAPGPPMISRGADDAIRLGEGAKAAFAKLEPLVRKRLAKWLDLRPEAARELRDGRDRALEAFRRVAEATGEEPRPPAVGDVTGVLLELAAGRLDGAAAAVDRLPPGAPRLHALYAYSTAILDRNAAALGGGRAPGAADLEAVNRYRLALGVSPLSVNPKLMEAAAGHSRDMRERGYYGPESPDPARRTKEDRAKLAGYGSGVTEFLHTSSSIADAMRVWLRSAVHHRLLVGTGFLEVGYGTAGPLTLTLGLGEGDAPPALSY